LEDRGYKCGSHALVGHQYGRVLKDKPTRIEVLLINHNLNNRKLSQASSVQPPARNHSNLKTFLDLWSSCCVNGYNKDQTKNNGIRRKRENEGINRRKVTLIKKAYELGEFDGIDVALII
jgi:hypothetical protein